MNKRLSFTSTVLLTAIALSSSVTLQGQSAISTSKTTPKGWHLKDVDKDGLYGISLEKTYGSLLKGRKPKQTVVVAVIDSGIDTLHEDLKPILWRNPGEIPWNGIDDDKNGYVDDVHGWNFIGGKDGRNVSKDSYEAARVYYKLKKIYGDAKLDPSTLTGERKEEYESFQKAREQIESQSKDAAMYVMLLSGPMEKLPSADSVLRRSLGKEIYTGNELSKLKPENADVAKARSTMLSLFQQTQQMDNTNKTLIEGLTQFYEGEKSKLDAAKKEPPRYRDDIVQDRYDDPNDRFYGNNDIMASDPSHGTHVAGIIGAARNNGIGMDGVADNVRIMVIRAVPDGDEHDKDIANAIRYAVDNGATVVNMSFGKSFSPEKKWVDEAVRYAESKDVLLVHAAGNDAKNIDVEDNFPNARYGNDKATLASNWMTVGASGPYLQQIAADFSNYGKEVDVFSPGVEIYSTLPGGNQYGNQQGTSMASPVTAGIAALILSYFPELSARQVKEAITKSVTRIPGTVYRPGAQDEVAMSELTRTAGIVNAYGAVSAAAGMKGERKLQESTAPKPKTKMVTSPRN